MSSNDPLVSVVMPVYNADEYLAESIESILNQTFRDFEFIIICDDPTNKTKVIIDNYQKFDDRITVLYQKKKGIVAALNTCCSLAKGKYIARMDADDISLPERLKIQVDFMEKHLDIGICGSWVRTFGEYNTTWKFPSNDPMIKATLLFRSSFAHPSVIIRKEIIKLFGIPYNEYYNSAEDYEFWVKCARITNFYNINKILLKYRIHTFKVSSLYKQNQEKITGDIFRIQLEALNIPIEEKKIALHLSLTATDFKINQDHLNNINKWLIEIIESNRKQKIYDNEALTAVIAQLWCNLCIMSTNNGIWFWNQFCNSPLSIYIKLTNIQKIKLFIACFLKMVNILKIEHILKIKYLLKI